MIRQFERKQNQMIKYCKFDNSLTKSPGTRFWMVLLVLYGICLLNYCYNDLQMIVRHSLNIWYQIENGSILQFYQTGYQLPIGDLNQVVGEVPYDFGLYIPIAIWNFPIYIWEKISGVTFDGSFIALLWTRVGLLIPFAGCNGVLWKIGEHLKKGKIGKTWLCFLFSSSMFLINGLFCIGQIDIINTFFTLMGLWAYLRKDKKKFIIWFMLAITCKMFALMIFLPLLILWEKRILYIIKNTLQALTITLITKIIFFHDKMQTPTTFDEKRFSLFLFERQIDLSNISVSVFILMFACLMIWCWNQKCNDSKWEYYAVWTAFAGYACFFCGATTYPYWTVVFSPFVPLLIVLFPDKSKILLWLETIAAALYFVKGMCDYGWIYSAEKNVSWMLAGIMNDRALRGIDFRWQYLNLSELTRQNLQSIFISGFWGAIAGILVMTYPAKGKVDENVLEVDRGSVWCRLFINASLAVFPLLCYLLFD